jgi:hypothetical protein
MRENNLKETSRRFLPILHTYYLKEHWHKTYGKPSSLSNLHKPLVPIVVQMKARLYDSEKGKFDDGTYLVPFFVSFNFLIMSNSQFQIFFLKKKLHNMV